LDVDTDDLSLDDDMDDDFSDAGDSFTDDMGDLEE
jgi:hypothetical protein